MLEVAIGTGYPIADHLQKAGHEVHGIDISPDLVRRCRELNPAIQAKVGDAEHLEYPDATFDATYCFHSSWYFPNLPARDRRDGPGHQAGRQPCCSTSRTRPTPRSTRPTGGGCTGSGPGCRPGPSCTPATWPKSVLRRGTPNWHAVNFEVPTDPAVVLAALRGPRRRRGPVFGRDEADQTVPEVGDGQPLDPIPRLVFAAHR